MSKNNSSLLNSRKRIIAAAVAACFSSAPVWGNPIGPQVVNGTASISQAGKLLTVTNSNGAIINWNTFSIGASETTRFDQASASSSVLNRVLANNPSVLLGTLSSNGRVWLVNPSGIMVGQGARIDVGGFIASTLNVRNEDFLAGRLNFGATPNAGSIQNYGQITTPSGGSVYLIAPAVTNNGAINAANGEVLLAAGQTVQLLDTGTPGVKVEITGTEGSATNLGQIVSEAGRIGLAGVLVRNSGSLNASSLVKEGGRIFLKASRDAYVDGAGRIVTTGKKGGSIEVLGNRVAVTDQAQLDASGDSGGGSVLVGGDYQGKNAAIQNSQITYFGPDAAIKADAVDKGDGGKVIVWADDTTRAYGNISVRGGPNGGNGGFVETSGRKFLDVTRAPNIAAPAGAAGTWLLDPEDITITSSSWNITASSPFQPAATGSSNLLASTLTSAINQGGTVTVDTTGGGTGNGDIYVAVPVETAPIAPATLNLLAHRHITLNANITSTGNPLAMNLVADQGHSGIGSITLYPNVQLVANNANISFSAAQGISIGSNAKISTGNTSGLGGGWADLTFTANANGGNGDFTSSGSLMSARDVTVNARNITLDGSITRVQDNAVGVGDGNVKLTAEQNVTLNSTAAISSAGTNGKFQVALRADALAACVAGALNCGTVSLLGSPGQVSTNGGNVFILYNPTGSSGTPGNTAPANGYIAGAYSTPTNFSTQMNLGGGTLNAWMLVNDLNQLQSMKTNLSGTYLLTRNIDATATSGWNGGAGFMPIGDNTTNFIGAFDGAAHTINNLYVNSSGYAGLFGKTGAASSIKNIGLIGGSFTGGADSSAAPLAGTNLGTIANAYATGSATAQGWGFAGGLVGWNNGGTISNSYATGNVTGGLDAAGGLVGYNLNGTISNSFATGNTVSAGNAGGLVGYNYSGTITNAYATGNANSTGATYASGGLIGYNNNGSISNSYAQGAVTGVMDVGGLVGLDSYGTLFNVYTTGSVNGTTINARAGGLVGTKNNGSITNAYATGSVSGSGSVGGLAASNSYSSVSNSFWDTQTTGQATSAAGTGLTTAQMTTQSNYTGWDFSSTWWMSNGNTRPFLRAEASTKISNAHQLQLMALNLAGNYTLAADIDMSESARASGVWGSAGFAPIGDATTRFSGTFDGLGHTISNLSINRPSTDKTGLLGVLGASGTVRNIGLLGGSVTSVGNSGELVGINYGNITNAYSSGNVSGGSTVGGLVGANYGSVSDSYATGNVTGTYGNVGGLVGYNGAGGSISNSYAAGTVISVAGNVGGLLGHNENGGTVNNSYAMGSVSGSSWVGGLVGFNNIGSTVANSHSTGTVTGSSNSVGGLVGLNYATIDNSYATGSVTGGDSVGGLVGESWYGNIGNSHATGSVTGNIYVGGLVGRYGGIGTSISNAYATGNVTGNSHVGGLVGYNSSYSGSITNAYATGSVAGNSYVGGLVGSNDGTVDASYSSGSVTGLTEVGGLIGYNGGTLSNSHYDIDSVTINGALHVTEGGLYTLQYQDWLNHGKTLDMASLPWSADGAYVEVGSVQVLKDLLGFADQAGYSFRLTSDLDLATLPDWHIPVFSGAVFNGGGHTLTNLSVNQPFNSNIGFIGRLSGNASNLTGLALTNVSVTGKNNVGALVGYNNRGTISTSYAIGNVAGASSVGGLVGYNGLSGSITDSYANVSVTGTGSNVGGLVGDNAGSISTSYANGSVTGISDVGGLAGSNWGDIADSHATGNVTGSNNLGGLVGSNGGEGGGYISYSYATGSVTGSGSNVGGLVGSSAYSSSIDSSYAIGAVTGGDHVGGLVGYNYRSSIDSSYATGPVSGGDYVGGLVGYTVYNGSIGNSYATGSVTGGDHVGGLVGHSDGSIIGRSYATGIVTGGDYVGGLAGCNINGEIGTSYATGSVTASSDYASAGGLVGYNEGSVTDSYATGSVSAAGAYATAGGLVGYNPSGTVGNSYWNIDTSLQSSSAGGVGKSTGEMKQLATYSGWSGIDNNGGTGATWRIYEGSTYPLLRSFLKPLTVTAVSGSKVYDGTATGIGVSYSLTPDPSKLLGIVSYTGANKDVASYTITPGGLYSSQQGYDISYAGGALTIHPYMVNLSGSRVYDGTASVAAGVLSTGALVGSETLTLSGSGTVADKNVGAGKAISLGSLALGNGSNGGLASNYTLSGGTHIASITARPLSVTAAGVSKVYDGLTSATVNLSDDRVVGDVLTIGTGPASYLDKNVGVAKTVNVSGINVSGIDAGNYTFNTAAVTTADITARALTITATGQNKVYDGLTSATVNLGDNRVVGDVLTVGTGPASYVDKNVGIAKSVKVNGITLTGADAANYTFNSAATTSADITPASVVVTGLAANSKLYDATTAASLSGGTLTGVIAGDAVSLSNLAGSFDDKNVGVAKPVAVTSLALSGTDAGNYILSAPSLATLSADITPASLTVASLAANSKVYDGSAAAKLSGGTLTGVFAGDVVSLSTLAGSFDNKNVGTAKPVMVTSLTLSGTDAGNYSFSAPSAATLSADITPAPLIVASFAANNKVYDGSTVATLSGGTLTGVIAGDAVSMNAPVGTFDNRNVGTAKPVTVTGLTLTGADAGNYTITAPSGLLAADITPLASVAWTGGTSGNWSQASNWAGGALPDGSNVLDVTIPSGASVIYDAAAGATNLASLSAAGLSVVGGTLNIANSLSVSSSFSHSGGTLGFGTSANASITQASGNLTMPGAALASLSLAASAGGINQSAPIIATNLITKSLTGTTLTNAGNKIAGFAGTNSGSGNMALTNTGALTIAGISNSGGNITVDNTGAVTTLGPIIAAAGSVSVTAHSPLTIGAGGVSAGGNITLTAGETSASTDQLTLSGPVSTTGSGASITLFAGDDILQNANVTSNGGAINAVARLGNISKALGVSTSSNGGSISYAASAGDVMLTTLDAGTNGAITLAAGGNIAATPSHTDVNLVGGTALIAAAGNIDLSTKVRLLDVTAGGLFNIKDLVSGSVISNVPQVVPTPETTQVVVNQVVSSVVTGAQQQSPQAATQTQTTMVPTPPAGGTTSLALSNTTLTTGGTAGTFGGTPTASTETSAATGGSAAPASTGTASNGDKPGADKPAGGKPADDKSADAKKDEKKDEKKEDKKDDKKKEEASDKKEDKPAAKKVATCS